MTDDRVPLVDRLAERGFVDRWAFLVFSLGGGVAIVLGKYSGLSAVPIAATAMIVMVAYAAIVQFSGTGRLRSDQAGDNCYYLGLIYTLSSLAYAIFFFDPADTATTIVQGFGIALATTIMGLVLRVFFSQSRVDLTETEDTARIELAKAAGDLKAELSQAVVSMNDFAHQTRQSIQELREAVIADIAATQKAATASITEVSAAATKTLSSQASKITNAADKYVAATERVIGGLEEHRTRVEALAEGHANTLGALDTVRMAADTIAPLLGDLAARAASMATAQGALAESGQGLQAIVVALGARLQGVETAAAIFDRQAEERLRQLAEAPAELGKNAAAAVDGAAAAVRAELTGLATACRQASEALTAQMQSTLSATRQHNDGLERELARSREVVGKVHGALVEMTGLLLRDVEARPSA